MKDFGIRRKAIREASGVEDHSVVLDASQKFLNEERRRIVRFSSCPWHDQSEEKRSVHELGRGNDQRRRGGLAKGEATHIVLA